MARLLSLVAVLAFGCGRTGELLRGESADASLSVDAHVHDLSVELPRDMTQPAQPRRDLALALDLATAPDLSAALDLAAAPDLTIADDLTAPSDLSIPADQARIRDLSHRLDLAGSMFAFGTPQTFTAGMPPGTGLGIAAGDFNNDSLADIAVANWGNNYTGSLAVLLGRGDGALMPPTNFYAGGGPFKVTVADLDRDGNEDLISSTEAIWCFFGRGDGTWRTPATSSSGTLTIDTIVADLNNDGMPDVAAIEANAPAGVRVYLGVDGGLLSPQKKYLAGTLDQAGTIGMFSRMGARGIVVADRGVASSGANATVQVLMVQPDGTLGAATGYAAHDSAWDVVAADFNRDGIDDIAVAEVSGGIGVYLANGDGTFAVESHFAGNTPGAIVAADFNADGVLDVATANRLEATVAVRLGAGDGTFDAPHTLGIGRWPFDIVAVDLDGDGLPDIATMNSDATVTVVLTRPRVSLPLED